MYNCKASDEGEITCYKSAKVVARREEGNLHDVPVPPPLHPILQEGQGFLGVLDVGDGHQRVGLAQKFVLALLQHPGVPGHARVVLQQLGVDQGGDDGHKDGLRAPLPKEIDQPGLVANHCPEKELDVRLLERPVADIYYIFLIRVMRR